MSPLNNSYRPGGNVEGRLIECPDNQIVKLDFRTKTWDCFEDEGTCPDYLGGVVMGCLETPQDLGPIPVCEYRDNPLGTCDGCDR